MKKVFMVIVALLVIAAGSAKAQVNPDYLFFDKGDFTDGAGTYYNESEIMHIIGPQIYNETYMGAIQQYNAGRDLIRYGGFGAAIGFLSYVGFYTSAVSHQDPSLLYGAAAGFITMSLGFVALDAGIPLKIIGKKRLEWIAEDYNDKNKTVAIKLTGCSAGPGVGIAVVF